MLDHSFAGGSANDEKKAIRKPNRANYHQQTQFYTEEVTQALLHEEKQKTNRSIDATLLFLFIAGIIELASILVSCENNCAEEQLFACFVGIISVGTTLGLIYFRKKRKAGKSSNSDSSSAKKYEPLLCIFLFFWWCFGATVTTFVGPFLEIGNGFFSVWSAVFLSHQLISLTLSQFATTLSHFQPKSQTITQKLLTMIGISSLLLVISAAVACYNIKRCILDIRWTAPIGLISLGIVAIAFFRTKNMIRIGSVKRMALALTALWSFLTIMTTFGDTFEFAGASYFACWSCCLHSIYLLFIETNQVEEEEEIDQESGEVRSS